MKREFKLKFKICLYIVLILVLLGALVFEIHLGNNKLKTKNIAFTKTGSINYVTYLKNNSHYTSSYLEDDYNFVANLVDYFNIDYDYAYVLNEAIDYNLEYDVNGLLEVYDSDNDTKPIEKKTYKLVDKKEENGNGQVIKVNIFNNKIEYASYNQIIQEWKKEVSPNATLKITINVNWKGFSKTLNKEISDKYSNTITIPLSEKTINITTPSKIDESGILKSDESLPAGLLVVMMSTGLILLTVVVCLIMTIFNNHKQKSKYDLKINKILREFDRAITEAKGKFVKDKDKHYIEVNEFMELMDVHDNLNEPIIYYKNSDDKCVFSVRNDDDIYYISLSRDEYDTI